ncbi:unnamed protein product [Meloidogyne enterolobii]|uniref:Uncharacterized protein n=1 Tax=Meloidogyne enterolobii TaxID=390850 RepID=A0ACB0YKY5_MELEN
MMIIVLHISIKIFPSSHHKSFSFPPSGRRADWCQRDLLSLKYIFPSSLPLSNKHNKNTRRVSFLIHPLNQQFYRLFIGYF